MPQLDRDEIVKIAKDAAYAVVGVGVLAVEQLDKVRQELAERVSTEASDLVTKARRVSTNARQAASDAGQQVRRFVLRDAA
jgi:histone H3/H4